MPGWGTVTIYHYASVNKKKISVDRPYVHVIVAENTIYLI
jgi:hypothetical protein